MRVIFPVVLAGLLLPAASVAVAQEDYPNRTITIVVPFSPGGTADVTARLLAQKLDEAFAPPVIVENRPGGATSIGTSYVAQAAPDGYTLLLSTTTHTINAARPDSHTPFVLEEDFAMVAPYYVSPFVLAVSSDFPATTIEELIAMVQERPGELNYASAGIGTPSHIAAELANRSLGLDIVHVPYQGAGEAVPSVIAGVNHMTYGALANTVPMVDSGQLRPLAVTGAERVSVFPDVPTMQEAGFPGYDVVSWNGIFAPAGTSEAIVELLNAEISKASEALAERFADTSGSPLVQTSPEFTAYVHAEIERWRDILDE